MSSFKLYRKTNRKREKAEREEERARERKKNLINEQKKT